MDGKKVLQPIWLERLGTLSDEDDDGSSENSGLG